MGTVICMLQDLCCDCRKEYEEPLLLKKKTQTVYNTLCIPIKEEAIDKIVALVGADFDRLQVINAYQLTGNDYHATIEHLYNNGYTNIGFDQPPMNKHDKCDQNIQNHTSCATDLMSCVQLNRLSKVVRVDNGDYKVCMDDIKINQVLDDYLYLQHHHSADDQFEHIHDRLGTCCTIYECDIFKRNHNRETTATGHDACYQQILDKIHCFYAHTFDIGYRLTEKERSLLSTDDTTSHLSQYTELLSDKRQAFQNYNENTEGVKNRTVHKYMQNMYSFGTLFNYGYDGEHIWNNKAIKVHPKYASLKDELLNNDIATISARRFENEYQKASVHSDTYYRKTYYPEMEIEHILSLMIYTNFDRLQREFTKTYRTEKGNQHDRYYYLGKHIKISVHEFGTTLAKSDIKIFYHGIGEQLVFPKYIGEVSSGISVYSPLSTSSSLSVAANFTNGNNGLIVCFGGGWNAEHALHHPWWCALSANKYLSVSWLSDYGNESECLFIQSQFELHINNIVDARSGSDFKCILFALRIIEVITSRLTMKANVTQKIKDVLRSLIEHQLSYALSDYAAYVSLNEYAVKLIRIYCDNKEWIEIDYLQRTNEDYQFFFDMLFHSKFEWIKLNLIHALFPSLKEIQIRNIALCPDILECIIHHLNSDLIQNSDLKKLIILPNKDSSLNMLDAETLYKDQLLKVHFGIRMQGGWLKILKIEEDDVEGHVLETVC
eukprot:715750_1